MTSVAVLRTLAASLLLLAANAASAVIDVSGAASGIAVAPFALSEEADEPVPDLASLLARRLTALSDARVVSPDALLHDERGLRDPQARDVRRWARWNSVENVVVGRVDRAGERGLRAAIELRSGHSGAARAEYRLEPDEAEDWGGAVTQLAILILAEVEASAPDAPARATSAEPGPAAEPEAGADAEPGRGEEGGLRLLPGVSRDDPISIESDELEVLPEDGGRRLVFSRNVRVQQGDITLEADRLEAVYPQGASQPDLLLASGRVRVVQGDRRGRCDEAIYDRDAQTIVCRGKAEVTQGCDQVRGEEIEFDLARERVRVTGAASVVIQPGSAEDGDCVPSVASNAPPEAAR